MKGRVSKNAYAGFKVNSCNKVFKEFSKTARKELKNLKPNDLVFIKYIGGDSMNKDSILLEVLKQEDINFGVNANVKNY